MAKVQTAFRIGFLLHDVSRLRRTVFDQEAKPMGITRAQWWALANLARHANEGMMQTDLAKALDVGKVTIGGLIDRLEVAGFVERRPDPNDRRANHVYITVEGKDLLQRMASLAERLNARITEGISKEHLEITADAMRQMKLNLIEMDAVPRSKNSAPPPIRKLSVARG